MDEQGLRIGVFARRHGVTATTVRYYERAGLLAAPPRSAGGYRLYGADDEIRLRFILTAKHLGLSLDEIRLVLRQGESEGLLRARARLRQLLAGKAGQARRQAKELEAFARHALRVRAALARTPAAGDAMDGPRRGIDHELVRADSLEWGAERADGKRTSP